MTQNRAGRGGEGGSRGGALLSCTEWKEAWNRNQNLEL